MSARMKIMLSAVALLIIINLWRWWPQADQMAKQTDATSSSGKFPIRLNLAGYEPSSGELIEVKRDLFSPVSAAPLQPEPAPVEKEIEMPAPDNTQRETAASEMAQYKLVGVLSRNGVKQAFLIRDNKNFRVRQGDRLEKHFRVEEVTLTSVTLTDLGSRTSKKIDLE